MEEKTNKTFLDPAIDLLGDVLSWEIPNEYDHLVEKIFGELKYLRMFIWGLEYWEDLQHDWQMRFSINSVMPKIHQLAKQIKSDCRHLSGRNLWPNVEAMLYELEEAIQQFKPQVKDICIHLLGGDFKCTSCPSNQKEFSEYARETASFCHFVQENLRYLQNYNLLAPVMKQHIASIRGKLEELGSYVEPVNLSITRVKKLYGLISCVRTWCSRIACLTYLYLVEGKDDNLTASMETLFVGLLHRNIPFNTSGVISSNSPRTMIPQLLGCHFDVLLEDLVIPMKDDLHEGLIFLLSFIMDPPQDDSEDREVICTQIYSIINEFLLSLTHSIRSGGGFCNVNFSDFMLKVDRVKAEVKKLYVVAPYSSQICPPFVNFIGFLDTTIRNLKEMLQEEVNLIPSLRHQGELFRKELVMLKEVESNITELIQDGHEEIRELRTSVICMVYNADYFMKLCLLRGLYLWYGIVSIPGVIEDIKSTKIEMNKLAGVDKRYTKERFPHDHDQIEKTDALLQRGTTSKIERDFTGFMEVERLIIDELIGGQKSLTIISISGSGGQGKTTLAKRIYNDSNVQHHFQKSVWCYVSKDCPVKEILIQLLSCITNSGGANELVIHDLVDRVRRSLKGRRYLIVMDDIWDSDGWQKLESSFPDDRNGSRILFTSRNHGLASQVKSNSIPHSLQLFSDEESWELMRKKVFGLGNCDEEYEGIGKKIASYCKGLPLAVVLIAGVLRRTGQYLNTWNKVAGNLKAHLNEEGCGNVIELSYKYLPDHLKSCFLYFGAFPRGEIVSANNLKLLWIGEGFVVQDGEAKFSKNSLASEYLEELVSQSLVIVSERSSLGGIKRCNVHDLLYDLCLERCREDNFLAWAEENSIAGYNDEYYWDEKVHKCSHHRLRIGVSVSDPFIESSPIVTERYLPTSPLHSLLCSGWACSFRFAESFKFLSILNLQLDVYKFPEVIFSMIYLGYLKLHFNVRIKTLPPEIANMRKLETLMIYCLYGYEYIWLPGCMWDMKCLMHVDIKDGRLCSKDSDQISSGNLFGGASNIERLGVIWLDVDDSTTSEFLQRFPHLRKLSCEITGHALKLLSMVGSLLTKLKSINVFYKGSLSPEPPNPTICNSTKIENLNKLSLNGTRILWSVLSEIGKKLPNLHVLKLRDDSCLGRIWEVKDGDFSKLIYLEFRQLDIEEIDVSSCDDNPFPCLEHLVVAGCTNLKELPCVLEEISTLKTIEVRYCRKEVGDSAMGIWKKQRDDWGNASLQVIVDEWFDSDSDEEEKWFDSDSDAEIYEEEYVQMSGLVSASLAFSDEQKKEVSSTPAFLSSMGSSGVGGDKSGRRNFKAKRMVKKMGSTAPSFTSSVVNNDQMQEETMAEDNVNSSMPVAPMFSQQPMPSPPGGYGFPAQSTNPFQFADVEVEEEDEEEEEVLHEHDSDDSAIAEPMRIKAKREKAKEERFLHWVEKRSVSGKGSITPNPEQESTFADQGSSTTSYSKEEGDHISQSSVVAEESALSLEEKNKQIEMSPTEMILARDIQEQNEILEHLHSDSEGSVIENLAQPNQTGILPSPGRVETEVERVPDAAETTRGLDFPFSVSLSVRGELSEQVDLKFESLYGFSSRNKPPENSEFKSCDFTSDADDYRILMRQKNREVKADHEKAIYIGWRLTSAPEEEKWRQASVMMLMDNAFTSLPSQPNSPNIVILFLQRNERLRKIPDSFFSLMRSVTFLDISGTRIRSLPSSLFGLDKLQVLRLRDSKCLDRLPEEIGLMKGLEVLDLFGTELYNMPDDVGNLSHLRQLLLSFYGNDDESENHDMSFFISPNIISRLRSLEELGISVYPEDKRWVSNVKFLINDLAKLNTLRCLDFYFPEVELLDRFTSTANAWENIRSKKFKFVVGKNVKRIVDRVPPEVEIKFNEHIRSLRFVNGEDVYEAVKKVAKYATALYLDHHLAIRSLSEMDITISKEMQFYTIRECPNLEKIIDDGKMVQPAYPRLEYLGMHYLWKLENIFGASLVKGSFGCLRSLVVDTCPMLEFILSESMVQCLWNLEELVVVNCTRVEEIIMKIDEEHVQTIEKKDTPVFPRLAKLQLQHLPQLHSFWWKLRGDSKDQLPNGSFTALHSAEVRSCPRLDLVSLESIKKDFSSRLEQTLQDGLL